MFEAKAIANMHATFETVQISDGPPGVAYITLNRPARSNAITSNMFLEIPAAIDVLDKRQDIRVVILRGAGKNFCSGIDLQSLGSLMQTENNCEGRLREQFRRDIKVMQAAFSAFEHCRKPVIAEIHGACIGGGIDMITACDMRYCTEDAQFSVKEVDLAITADLGTLQRLPLIVGDGAARELALTARLFNGNEARRLGLVTDCYSNVEQLAQAVETLAKAIASKSPLAITGTKTILLHSRDHSVEDSLNYTAIWNSAMLLSSDIQEVLTSRVEKRLPLFSKL